MHVIVFIVGHKTEKCDLCNKHGRTWSEDLQGKKWERARTEGEFNKPESRELLQQTQLNNTKTNPVSKWTKNLNRHFSQEEKERANLYLKRHSISLASRKMQIKNIYLVAIILQNVKHTVTIWTLNYTPRFVLKNNKKYTHRKICTQIFITTFIHRSQSRNNPSVLQLKRINKLFYPCNRI